MLSLKVFILLQFPWSYNIVAASRTNFQVKSYKLCTNTQGLIKYYGNITKEGDNYYTSGRMILPVPLDENIGATCKIESLVVNTYVELFIIREKYMCKAVNMYLGELWHDLERGAQVLPATCPLPAGRYESHHVKIDFNKVALQTFPFGHLKFTLQAVDNKLPHNHLLCVVMEVENVPN